MKKNLFKKKILHRAKYRGIKELDIIFYNFLLEYENIITNDELYEAVRKASRILEDLPLEDLPESVTQAAQNLRDALDTMPAPEKETSPFKDDPLTPGRADVYSYLNET